MRHPVQAGMPPSSEVMSASNVAASWPFYARDMGHCAANEMDAGIQFSILYRMEDLGCSCLMSNTGVLDNNEVGALFYGMLLCFVRTLYV